MQRRKFITLLSGAAASSLSPLAARAQQPTVPVLGQLHYSSTAIATIANFDFESDALHTRSRGFAR